MPQVSSPFPSPFYANLRIFQTMKVLIAPTALKGSLTARAAAQAMATALPTGMLPIICPVADGGDGTLECLVDGTNGMFFDTTVRGPVGRMNVRARWGVLGDGSTAVIEMAEAAGLRLLNRREYDVAHASSFGVGQLIRAALDAGYRRILVGLGGSATNDGGTGMARALGVRFLNRAGHELSEGGIWLNDLQSIDMRGLHPAVSQCVFSGLADVDSPLCGPEGTTKTFAAQKGASTAEIEQLESAMMRYAGVVKTLTGTDVLSLRRVGAAGGMGVALREFCRADLRSGIDFVLRTMKFDSLLQSCDLVLTAEGMIDSQTFQGKAIAGIAQRALFLNKPVHAFAGRVVGGPAVLAKSLGIASVRQISPSDIPTAEAMSRASEFLTDAVSRFLESLPR